MNIREIKNQDELVEKLKDLKSFKDAIRLKCLDCCAYELGEIKKCESRKCPLWEFRLGHRPK